MKKIKKSFISILFLAVFSLGAYAIDPATVNELVPLGNTTGIKLFFDGVTVVDVSEVETQKGMVNPAKLAGISPGDVIKSVDGQDIHSNEQLKKLLESCDGKPITVKYTRGKQSLSTEIMPVKNTRGEYKAGIWIRDSMAGIGTLTFYDPTNKIFGALGHGICDSESEEIVPFGSGTLMESKVVEVKKGEPGKPGELVGEYNLSEDSGIVRGNTEAGIFGEMGNTGKVKRLKALPICRKGEVHTGKAQMLSNVSGEKVEEYSIEIVRIFADNGNDTKNFMLHVTDKKLIEKTGGIVQGMSGSPILQNGKLVGAVTHVLINDPTRGYGIFIENMLSEAEKIK